jgi:hypothetical protein
MCPAHRDALTKRNNFESITIRVGVGPSRNYGAPDVKRMNHLVVWIWVLIHASTRPQTLVLKIELFNRAVRDDAPALLAVARCVALLNYGMNVQGRKVRGGDRVPLHFPRHSMHVWIWENGGNLLRSKMSPKVLRMHLSMLL